MSIEQKWDTSQFEIASIKVARDNDLIYGSFALDSDDDAQLLLSIKSKGILEPLVLSADHVLLSGHRRLAAARYLGLTVVPVRIHDVVFEALPKDERLKTLAAFNKQRDKSFNERTAERLLDIDPKVARAKLFAKRIQNERQPALLEKNVDLGIRKHRAAITTHEFCNAVQKIVSDNERYWPLTDRRVHYLLLNDPPRRHDKKPDRYANDLASYKALTNLLVRMRLASLIPIDAIEDPTRPVTGAIGFSSADQFVAQELQHLLCHYRRNLMAGQPAHVEIILEKSALRSVVHEVAEEFCVPLTVGRGFCSLSPRYDLVMRFRHSGKRRLVLLFLTDFDPDGEAIASSFARSLRDDFGINEVFAHKVLLNQADVVRYDLPSDLDAKKGSPNYKKFVEQWGTQAVELDAVPAELIQEHLREAIERAIDIDLFNRQVEAEANDAALIQAKREAILNFAMGERHD
jgi:hypothetical protein